MEKRWINKNADLGLLTSHIGDFFKEKDFEAVKGEIPTGYQIFAEGSPHFKLNGYVSVSIEGKPNDFKVKLELHSDKKKRHSLPILTSTMFFGGYLLSKRLRAEDDWFVFEKEFWKYVDNIVIHHNSPHGNNLP